MFSDFPVCNTIQTRHSVRTFDARPLDAETMAKLTAYAKNLRNPFNVPVTVHALEMLRLAPSATNAQPWRILRRDGAFHFYAKASEGKDEIDPPIIQRVDVGIGANHFCLTAWEQGIGGSLKVMDAPTDTGAPENYRYLFSWTEEET
ncbi:MAG: nitroreductase family protein [Oscillospiraceae bacterium]|nr:nitroreductase family protein [Oscillospiraceae bacterium]